MFVGKLKVKHAMPTQCADFQIAPKKSNCATGHGSNVRKHYSTLNSTTDCISVYIYILLPGYLYGLAGCLHINKYISRST